MAKKPPKKTPPPRPWRLTARLNLVSATAAADAQRTPVQRPADPAFACTRVPRHRHLAVSKVLSFRWRWQRAETSHKPNNKRSFNVSCSFTTTLTGARARLKGSNPRTQLAANASISKRSNLEDQPRAIARSRLQRDYRRGQHLEQRPTMADPFEVRMRFTNQLRQLNASVTSAQKAAQYALKYRDMAEDLHSCILEQLERVCGRGFQTAGYGLHLGITSDSTTDKTHDTEQHEHPRQHHVLHRALPRPRH